MIQLVLEFSCQMFHLSQSASKKHPAAAGKQVQMQSLRTLLSSLLMAARYAAASSWLLLLPGWPHALGITPVPEIYKRARQGDPMNCIFSPYPKIGPAWLANAASSAALETSANLRIYPTRCSDAATKYHTAGTAIINQPAVRLFWGRQCMGAGII